MMNRLQKLPLFRPKSGKSDYIGTDVTHESAGTLTVEVQPISDNATAELYGVNVSRSVLLLCDPGADISEQFRVEIRDEIYEIKGVTRFGNITKAAAERVITHERSSGARQPYPAASVGSE